MFIFHEDPAATLEPSSVMRLYRDASSAICVNLDVSSTVCILYLEDSSPKCVNFNGSCVNLELSCPICGVNLLLSCVGSKPIGVYVGKAGRIEGITGLTDIDGGTGPMPPTGVKPRLRGGAGTGSLTEGKAGRMEGKTGNTELECPTGVTEAGGHGGINGFGGADIGESEGGHGGGELSGIGGFGPQ